MSAATWFWLRLKDAKQKDAAEHEAIMAMLHTQLFSQGMLYLHRGYITNDELDDFNQIFGSYERLGGNGTGKEIHRRVCLLRMETSTFGIVEAAQRRHQEEQQS